MIKKLPIIVLCDDVVFPRMDKTLSLEKAYNVRACEIALDSLNKGYGGHVLVAIIKDSAHEDDLSSKSLLDVGVLCDLVSYHEIESGEDKKCRIVLRGMKRIKFKSIEWNDETQSRCWFGEFSTMKTSYSYKPVSVVYENETFDVSADIKSFMEKDRGDDLEFLIDKIADTLSKKNHKSLSLKKQILVKNNVMDRLSIVLSIAPYLKKQIYRVYAGDKHVDSKNSISDEIDEQISKKVSKNINRQQKEFYLREKLKVIKEELGDTSSKEVEIRKIREQILKGKYPQNIVDKAKEELQRFEMCSSYSNEATVIRSYLDWILNLPWMYMSKNEMDLKKVQKVLDSNHYGLEKIKERIIEFLAVKKKSSKDAGTIICFVGPPGVGKTSLAQSIASALNKKFVKISLGGLYDESELRGHRRTYVASMPGKIIRALRQAKVKNPVFLLDEIDKISAGYHGDPVHALLEILDPKQNEKFNDHYIEEDFDLSKVMFIATANYEENIPEPLMDRMEMIYLRTYTETEKLNIAKNHLIPDVLRDSGLSDEELKFADDAVVFIIQRYTREAGVRSLKKQIEKIVRKVVKGMVVDGKEIKHIGIDEVKLYLESEIFDITKKDEDVIPGVVNGMAYTDFGGDLLPIEVNHVSGKGNLSLTGNLRDTMKESASVALAYVRANEDQLGLKDKAVDWNNIDVNLHVPTGGTPKDGPSAGVTIATALISSFSGKPVSPRVAMTGEITLRGKVLPIGGLREKVVSAVRGGVDTIFYPEANTRNLSDIPDEIKSKIKLIPVKHYLEIYNNLF